MAQGITYRYLYDFLGRPTQMRASNGFTIKLAYDEFNRTSNVKYQVGGDVLTTQWRYGNASVVYGVKYNGVEKISYDYDSLMRRTSTTINTTVPFVTNYVYKGVGNNTSTQLASIWYSNSDAFNYTYDANGNITSITHPAGYELVHYHYDALNQLIREDNYELNKTVTYTYDNGGNIRSVKEYAYTTGNLGSVVNQKTYTYGDSSWKDLLTNYNGVNIAYDAIGNPTNWINGESFSWVDGRRLANVVKGNTNIAYAYNEDGIRTSKNVNGVRTDYYLNGTAVIMQKTGDNCIWYTYDENGLATGFRYNGNEYYYFRNGQNDIIGIVDASGATVARYTYDSWGNHVSITDGNGYSVASDSSHIANINPFRYRGYYFDTETGLYYLNSRYYDANVGRFINADSVLAGSGESVQGYNLFAYCMNNPINLTDENGNWPKWANILAGAALAVVAVAATVATLGAAAPAAACSLTMMGMYMGASYTVAHAAATVAVGATVAAAAMYAGDMAYQQATGVSPVKEVVFQGNQEAYEIGFAITSIATAGMMDAATLSPGVCFVAGTPVLAANGYISIEEVKVGDMVWAENPETGEKELKEVVQTFVNETEHLVYIFANGEEIITTPEHPFYSPTKGWTAACKLRAGDILVSQNGSYVIVEKIQHEILEAPITVYNFEVADFHTYYVGKSAVLVHNTCDSTQTISTTSDTKLRFNDDQNAVLQLAKDYRKFGISNSDANILWGWAEEYGLAGRSNFHGPQYDSYLGGVQFHMKINGWHINILGEK